MSALPVRTSGVGVFAAPMVFAELADARLETGDLAGARTAVEQGVAALADVNGARARLELAQARVLLGSGDVAAAGGALDRARAAVDVTGSRICLPFIQVERAELARLRGDDVACRRERREAIRLFTEVGAPLRAAALAGEP